jgi:hypothetical protein
MDGKKRMQAMGKPENAEVGKIKRAQSRMGCRMSEGQKVLHRQKIVGPIIYIVLTIVATEFILKMTNLLSSNTEHPVVVQSRSAMNINTDGTAAAILKDEIVHKR